MNQPSPSLILVVEDQESSRVMIASVLKAAGYRTIAVPGGAEAIAKLQSEPVNLIVCDWHMPGMTGFEVLTFVRSAPLLKDLPFVMVTCEGDPQKVRTAIEAGVTDYIVKPFPSEALTGKVARALRKAQKSGAKRQN